MQMYSSSMQQYRAVVQSPSATSTGIVSTFARAGFKVMARHAPERPIVRYEFKPPKARR
jgi:hypothetical protein